MSYDQQISVIPEEIADFLQRKENYWKTEINTQFKCKSTRKGSKNLILCFFFKEKLTRYFLNGYSVISLKETVQFDNHRVSWEVGNTFQLLQYTVYKL